MDEQNSEQKPEITQTIDNKVAQETAKNSNTLAYFVLDRNNNKHFFGSIQDFREEHYFKAKRIYEIREKNGELELVCNGKASEFLQAGVKNSTLRLYRNKETGELLVDSKIYIDGTIIRGHELLKEYDVAVIDGEIRLIKPKGL